MHFDSKLDKSGMTWKEDRETLVQNRTAVHERIHNLCTSYSRNMRRGADAINL